MEHGACQHCTFLTDKGGNRCPSFWPPAARALGSLSGLRLVETEASMPFFRGRGQDHEAAGLSASESDESDLEVCHAHHAPTPPHARENLSSADPPILLKPLDIRPPESFPDT